MGKRKSMVLICVALIVVVLTVVFWVLKFGKERENKKSSDDDNKVVNSTTEETFIEISTNDWTSFEFYLGEKRYAWPITYTELLNDGYAIKKEEDYNYENVENFVSRHHMMYYEGDKTIWFSASFKEEDTLSDSDSPDYYVDCLSFREGSTEEQYEVVLCNGIRLGISYEEMVSMMGLEADKDYYTGSGDDRFGVTYENDDKTRMIRMTFVNDKLSEIHLYDNTFRVYASDWENLVFSLNGKTYTWPVSYTQLIEDGYDIVEKDYETYTDNPLLVTHFMWDEDYKYYTFTVGFRKPSEDADLADSYVEHIAFYDFEKAKDYKVELGNGIALGDSYDEVVEAMGKPTSEGMISGGGYEHSYSATYETEDGLGKIEFIFDGSRDVYEIDIYNFEGVEA